ncbi:hypothetical protein HDU96_008184 [Phlyctochytrium bullatum]|nr:hypothetical protein HDU96_008184 [Phlyctochytrium bullatum]
MTAEINDCRILKAALPNLNVTDSAPAICCTHNITGVLDYKLAPEYSVICRENRIIGVDFDDWPINGALTVNIANLTFLEHLRLRKCNLSGPLPASLGSLSKLEYLFVENNYLNGSVPEPFLQLGNRSIYGNCFTKIENASAYRELRVDMKDGLDCDRFYQTSLSGNSSASDPAPRGMDSSTQQTSPNHGPSIFAIAGTVAAAVALTLIAAVLVFFFIRKRRRRAHAKDGESTPEVCPTPTTEPTEQPPPFNQTVSVSPTEQPDSEPPPFEQIISVSPPLPLLRILDENNAAISAQDLPRLESPSSLLAVSPRMERVATSVSSIVVDAEPEKDEEADPERQEPEKHPAGILFGGVSDGSVRRIDTSSTNDFQSGSLKRKALSKGEHSPDTAVDSESSEVPSQLARMTAAEVSEELMGMGVGAALAAALEDHNVDGGRLCSLTDGDLRAMGIEQAISRELVLRAIGQIVSRPRTIATAEDFLISSAASDNLGHHPSKPFPPDASSHQNLVEMTSGFNDCRVLKATLPRLNVTDSDSAPAICCSYNVTGVFDYNLPPDYSVICRADRIIGFIVVIAGTVTAAVALTLIAAVLVFIFIRKRRRNAHAKAADGAPDVCPTPTTSPLAEHPRFSYTVSSSPPIPPIRTMSLDHSRISMQGLPRLGSPTAHLMAPPRMERVATSVSSVVLDFEPEPEPEPEREKNPAGILFGGVGGGSVGRKAPSKDALFGGVSDGSVRRGDPSSTYDFLSASLKRKASSKDEHSLDAAIGPESNVVPSQLAGMTAAQVSEELMGMGVGAALAAALEDHNVDGMRLCSLTDGDLRAMGIDQEISRELVLRAVGQIVSRPRGTVTGEFLISSGDREHSTAESLPRYAD